MRVLLALAAALCLLGASKVAAQSCHLRELDLCAATLLLFNQGPGSIATTDEELNRQCGYIKEAYQCVGNFTRKCMTPLQRELINFVTEGTEDHLNDFCNEGGEIRTSYLKQAPCLKDAYGDARGCLNGLQTSLEHMLSIERSKRIPAGCCLFQSFRGCVIGKIQEKCGDGAIKFIDDVINLVAANLPDAICSDFKPESPKCVGLLPDPNAPPKAGKSNSVLSRLFSAYLGS